MRSLRSRIIKSDSSFSQETNEESGREQHIEKKPRKSKRKRVKKRSCQPANNELNVSEPDANKSIQVKTSEAASTDDETATQMNKSRREKMDNNNLTHSIDGEQSTTRKRKSMTVKKKSFNEENNISDKKENCDIDCGSTETKLETDSFVRRQTRINGRTTTFDFSNAITSTVAKPKRVQKIAEFCRLSNESPPAEFEDASCSVITIVDSPEESRRGTFNIPNKSGRNNTYDKPCNTIKKNDTYDRPLRNTSGEWVVQEGSQTVVNISDETRLEELSTWRQEETENLEETYLLQDTENIDPNSKSVRFTDDQNKAKNEQVHLEDSKNEAVQMERKKWQKFTTNSMEANNVLQQIATPERCGVISSHRKSVSDEVFSTSATGSSVAKQGRKSAKTRENEIQNFVEAKESPGRKSTSKESPRIEVPLSASARRAKLGSDKSGKSLKRHREDSLEENEILKQVNLSSRKINSFTLRKSVMDKSLVTASSCLEISSSEPMTAPKSSPKLESDKSRKSIKKYDRTQDYVVQNAASGRRINAFTPKKTAQSNSLIVAASPRIEISTSASTRPKSILVKNDKPNKSLRKNMNVSLEVTAVLQKKSSSSLRMRPQTPGKPILSLSSRSVASPLLQTPRIREQKSSKSSGAKGPDKSSGFKRTVMPNFAQIHKKANERLESLQEYSERKKERAKMLLNASSAAKSGSKLRKSGSSRETCKKEKTSRELFAQNEPKKGFTRFGFKIRDVSQKRPAPVNNPPVAAIPNSVRLPKAFQLPKKVKTPVFARKEVAEIANKNKKGNVENNREMRRNTLKGVRINRRFELLMKMRVN